MPKTRSLLSGGGVLAAGLAVLASLLSSNVAACTIPVFRYALERWQSDQHLLIVYHDGPLKPEHAATVTELVQRCSSSGGPLNLRLVQYDVKSPPDLPGVQPPPPDQKLPWIEIRGRIRGVQPATLWQGPLDAATNPALFESPARRTIIQRTLDGHSAVWLLVAPQSQLTLLTEQLQANLDRISQDLRLPGGIGLPGSELYASIPLAIRYSVLAVSHDDPEEQEFFQMLRASAEQWSADSAYVIPIFGRGRALDVIPFDQADEFAIEEVASFLCAACSCRVKQANPGFDLLTAVDWDRQLFGESASPPLEGRTVPPESSQIGEDAQTPQYVAIPVGDHAPSVSETAVTASPEPQPPSGESVQVASNQTPITPKSHPQSWIMSLATQKVILVVVLVLLAGGVLTRRIYHG